MVVLIALLERWTFYINTVSRSSLSGVRRYKLVDLAIFFAQFFSRFVWISVCVNSWTWRSNLYSVRFSYGFQYYTSSWIGPPLFLLILYGFQYTKHFGFHSGFWLYHWEWNGDGTGQGRHWGFHVNAVFVHSLHSCLTSTPIGRAGVGWSRSVYCYMLLPLAVAAL